MIRSVAADGRPDLGGVFTPIDRPRVLERIAAAARYRIAAIIAPAGFGKSVAMRQYLARMPSAIVFEVPRDAVTLVTFVRAFVRALAPRVPALAKTMPMALHGIVDSDHPGSEIATWVRSHLSELNELVVIDDLQVGEAEPEITAFVTAVLDAPELPTRWLLSSRGAANLPFASWLAYGDMDLMVDAVDLRFTWDEARQSARQARVAVRDDELQAILELVEGWPTALTFALRTSTRAHDLRAVKASTREMVFRYLAEQVYRTLDEDTRRFLRFASLLPQLDLRLAVAGGFDGAHAMVEALRERVAFISAIDNTQFRLHDLFRDFLRRQIELDGAAVLQSELAHAAAVLEHEGEPAYALERYIEAKLHVDVERVLAGVGFALFDSGNADIVERSLAVLPRRLIADNLHLLSLRAAVEEYHGRLENAESSYRTVMDRSADPGLKRTVALRLCRLMADLGRSDIVPFLQTSVDDQSLDPVERAEMGSMLAVAHAMSGDIARSQSEINKSLASCEMVPDELRARILGRACGIAMVARDDSAVQRFGTEAIRISTAIGALSTAARTYSLLWANTHWQPAQRSQTLWYAQQSVNCAARSGDLLSWTNGLGSQMELESERGNLERVSSLQTEYEKLERFTRSRANISHTIARSLASAWSGDFAAAHQMMRAVTPSQVAQSHQYLRLVYLAIYYAADDRRSDALVALREAQEARALVNPTFPTWYDHLLIGARLEVIANVAAARRTLALRSVRGLEPIAGLETLDAALRAMAIDDGAALDDSLAQLAKSPHFSGFGKLIAAVNARLVPETIETEGLTATELDVLRSMASGRSNKDIAEEQRRTVNTVRSHVSSVLRKLNAKTRGEAVASARRLHLI